MRRHSSFLLRCWEPGTEGQRIEVEHIQSGTRMLARSVTDAVEWICEQGDAATQSAPDSGQASVEIGIERLRGGSN